MTNFLRVWVVYAHPKDYPDKFVARLYFVGAITVASSEHFKVADTLDEIRSMLPPGLVCMDRHKDDDPCIVEAWI